MPGDAPSLRHSRTAPIATHTHAHTHTHTHTVHTCNAAVGWLEISSVGSRVQSVDHLLRHRPHTHTVIGHFFAILPLAILLPCRPFLLSAAPQRVSDFVGLTLRFASFGSRVVSPNTRTHTHTHTRTRTDTHTNADDEFVVFRTATPCTCVLADPSECYRVILPGFACCQVALRWLMLGQVRPG